LKDSSNIAEARLAAHPALDKISSSSLPKKASLRSINERVSVSSSLKKPANVSREIGKNRFSEPPSGLEEASMRVHA